jgi:hypothetical protein
MAEKPAQKQEAKHGEDGVQRAVPRQIALLTVTIRGFRYRFDRQVAWQQSWEIQ